MSVVVSTNYSSTRLIIVMGVTGCGKTTVGSLLADQISCPFIDGDVYHSSENKAKMRAGIALTDEDRCPWLRSLVKAMIRNSKYVVVSCSSLKRAYRDTMTQLAGEPILFIYLDGSVDTLTDRLANRQGHFMNRDLLSSQLATLEVPGNDEHSFSVSIEMTTNAIVEQIRKQLR